MASPFAVFRRNQKIMLAVVGVAAMVAFVFLDPVMRYVGGGSGPKSENPIVVETKYGDLRARDLEGLRYQRQVVELFLQSVVQQSVSKQFGQSNIDSRWLSGMLQQQYMVWRSQVMGRSVAGPEAEAVETMVLAERAKQMGLVITDQMINELIQQVSGDSLSASELQALIKNLQPQREVTIPKLFEALRTELLASKYRDLFAQSLADLPPAQRFEYYSRLNRRAKTEVMSLAVADFASQVADPSDAELKEFYEKYKNQVADPTSPEPGFKEPKRASFQYFKGSVDQLTEKLKAEVTDEEVKKYYEENKRNFIATSLDSPDAKPADSAAPAEGTEKKEGEAPPAEGEPKKEDAAPPTEEKPADAPAEEKPAEVAPEEKPASEPPATEEKPADAPAAPEEKPAESPQASYRGAGQSFRLVSTAALQDAETSEPKSDPPAEQPAAEAPAETPPAEQPAEAPAAPAAEEKPAEPAAEEKPASEPAAPEGTPAEEKPADPGSEIVKEPAVPAEPQYEPLEKVQDTIRETLAREKAAERLSTQFDELSAKMRRYTDDYDIYNTEKGTNANAKPPVPLDFAELAKGTELTPLELKSVAPLQAAKEDIGKSFRVIQSQGGARTIPFVDFAYADSLPTFKPEIDRDNENNYYLFWKTEEEPSYVPPLDQVRDQVVRAWKLIKARDLAKKRAEEYAQQAGSSKKSLTELFGKQQELKITELAPFSWLTLGNVPAQPGGMPRLSEVEGIDQAGVDFMKAVFGLQPGGLGVASNVPEDTVFVIRVIDFEPSEDRLRDNFARENPNRYMTAARDDQFKIYEKWIADLNKEADVHWLRQADARSQQTAESEGEF